MHATILPPLLLAILLVIALVTDLRARLIPNRLNLAVALAAPAWWFAQGLSGPEILFQIGCAFGLLVFFGLAFALGMMGGGDVKLIAALGLWLPPLLLLTMLLWMAICGGVLTLVCVALPSIRRKPGRTEVPYGVAIVAATFLVMANDILTKPIA